MIGFVRGNRLLNPKFSWTLGGRGGGGGGGCVVVARFLCFLAALLSWLAPLRDTNFCFSFLLHSLLVCEARN